ncbi:MAG: hypothetical protein PHI35_01755 [Victivallaceae bacterium]|nr:hypothetical protein [Victivallaceae bacterium]
MRYRPENNWNEFQWEREIRRDERRISCYFSELPACLDLPGEEDMIFDSLLSRPGLVPASGAESLHDWLGSSNDEDDSDDFEEPDPHRPGTELIEQFDRMAAEWNSNIVASVEFSGLADALGVACSYGKLLARLADFVDAREDFERGLKVSLGKRVLADINDLAGDLRQMIGIEPRHATFIAGQLERTSHLLERASDLLLAYRGEKKSGRR